MSVSHLQVTVPGRGTASLRRVVVRHELNRHSYAEVELHSDVNVPYALDASLGQTLQIDAVQTMGSRVTIFKGPVLRGHVEYRRSITANRSEATLFAESFSYKMSVAPRRAYYKDKTVRQVFDALQASSGVTISTTVALPTSTRSYHQNGESDFDFLLRLADDLGLFVVPGTDTASVTLLDAFAADKVTLAWGHDTGLNEFDLRGQVPHWKFEGAHYNRSESSSSVSALSRVTVPGLDAAQIALTTTAKTLGESGPSNYMPRRDRLTAMSTLTPRLETEAARTLVHSVIATGRAYNPQIAIGKRVAINGANFVPSEEFGVFRVTHRFGIGNNNSGTGYSATFDAVAYNRYLSPQRPLAPTASIVPAKVIESHDPENLGRIKVCFYWQEGGQNSSETHWIPVAMPHGGPHRGIFFMPEEGDEVLIAFEDGDPERPIVIGSVWNHAHKAPRTTFWPAAPPAQGSTAPGPNDFFDNDLKGIYTKSGHAIELIDKTGKETISIMTPAGLQIVLTDKATETNRPMITLHSEAGDIFLSAPQGRVHVHSKFFSKQVGDHE